MVEGLLLVLSERIAVSLGISEDLCDGKRKRKTAMK